MKAWKDRTTLPIDQYTGTIFKIQMRLPHKHVNHLHTVNIGAHLMTNEDTEEVTICTLDGKAVTYSMGHTYSGPASLEEIADWVAEKIDEKLRIKAEYEREMFEEEQLQRSGNIYQA